MHSARPSGCCGPMHKRSRFPGHTRKHFPLPRRKCKRRSALTRVIAPLGWQHLCAEHLTRYHTAQQAGAGQHIVDSQALVEGTGRRLLVPHPAQFGLGAGAQRALNRELAAAPPTVTAHLPLALQGMPRPTPRLQAAACKLHKHH